jgi:hypothetical protein
MTKIFSNRTVFATIAIVFLVAALFHTVKGGKTVAPTGLTLVSESQTFSGPTMPPGPWNETKLKANSSGPTMPPGPWNETKRS